MKDEIIKKTTGMRANSIEELSADYEFLGIQRRRQLGKNIISKGGPWVSIGFVFQELGKSIPKLMLASFKSVGGVYTRFSYFNIKNKEEAKKIYKILKDTFGDLDV